MTVADTLDYISFFSFRCNGTSVLAEIHRVIMNDLTKYQEEVIDAESFYDFLFNIAKDLFPDKSVGSCSEPRFVFASGSNTTNWSHLQKQLLDLCQAFHTNADEVHTKEKLNNKVKTMISTIINAKDPCDKKKKLFCGAGSMGAMQFVHMAAIFGLIPLYCFTYAELTDDDLGPATFIRDTQGKHDTESFTIQDVDNFFKDMHKDITKIWGCLITLALLENMLCELSRCYKKTLKKVKKENPSATNTTASIILNDDLMEDGATYDVCYYDHKRCCVQNFFNLGMNNSALRPELVMKNSLLWHENNMKAHISLTNWCLDKNDTKNLQWEHQGKDRRLSTLLQASEKLEKLMLLDN